MAVTRADSTEKIKYYIENLEKEVLVLSNLFFRDYTCPSGCGGCCPRFTLDYVKDSDRWKKFVEHYPEKVHYFEERIVGGQVFMSDLQMDHENHHCRNLNMNTGRCTIHESNPFSCEFELLKITTTGAYKKFFGADKASTIIKKLFGRAWQLTRIDGTKGVACEMIDFNYEKFLRDIELFEELRDMIKGFGKENKKLDLLIDYLKDNSERFKQGFLPVQGEGEKNQTIAITEQHGVMLLKDLKKIFKEENLEFEIEEDDFSDLETTTYGYRDLTNEH